MKLNKLLAVLGILALVLTLTPMVPSHRVSADDENVTVIHTDLIDGGGYHYGEAYSLDSTVNDTVCVFTYVSDKQNVYGSVVPMIQLNANETGVNIGQYVSADHSQDWGVTVAAKWRRGECADQ